MRKVLHIKILVFWLSCAIFLFCSSLNAQRFKAKLSRTTVAPNELVTLTITGNGENLTRLFQIPAIPNIMVVGTAQRTFSDGSGIIKIEQEFTLQALYPGVYKLKPFMINGGRNRIETNAVTLTVNPSSNNSSAVIDSQHAFMRCDISNKKAFVGAQIELTIRVYHPEGTIFDYGNQALSSPAFNGFWHERGPGNVKYRDTVITENGILYYGKTLIKEFLFANQTGKLIIPEYHYQCYIQQVSTDPFGGYFAPQIPVDLISKSIEIEILPLPDKEKPKSFTGQVGVFSLASTADHDHVAAYEPVTLTAAVSGFGNLKMYQMPTPVLPKGFSIVPMMPLDESEVTTGGVIGRKTFSWKIIPPQAGDFQLDSFSFSFFNPEQREYVTLHTPKLNLHVDPALSGDSSFVKNNLPDHSNNGSSYSNTTLKLIFISLVVFGILAFTIWFFKRRNRQNQTKNIGSIDIGTEPSPPTDWFLLADEELLKLSSSDFINHLHSAYHKAICRHLNLNFAEGSLNTISYQLRKRFFQPDQINSLLEPLEQLPLLQYSNPDHSICKNWLDVCRNNLLLLAKA